MVSNNVLIKVTLSYQKSRRGTNVYKHVFMPKEGTFGWLIGTAVERRSLTGEISLTCARPAADG